jgi:hypothetical protein
VLFASQTLGQQASFRQVADDARVFVVEQSISPETSVTNVGSPSSAPSKARAAFAIPA